MLEADPIGFGKPQYYKVSNAAPSSNSLLPLTLLVDLKMEDEVTSEKLDITAAKKTPSGDGLELVNIRDAGWEILLSGIPIVICWFIDCSSYITLPDQTDIIFNASTPGVYFIDPNILTSIAGIEVLQEKIEWTETEKLSNKYLQIFDENVNTIELEASKYSGLENAVYGESTELFYKVSDDTPTINELLPCVLRCTISNVETIEMNLTSQEPPSGITGTPEDMIRISPFNDYVYGIYFAINNIPFIPLIYVVSKAGNYELQLIMPVQASFPSAGIYMVTPEALSEMQLFDDITSLSMTYGNQKINLNYLPETIATKKYIDEAIRAAVGGVISASY